MEWFVPVVRHEANPEFRENGLRLFEAEHIGSGVLAVSGEEVDERVENLLRPAMKHSDAPSADEA
ncbi:hypothetical protein Vi05172_g315 [Venturia inaequalis]|nr:hypothetical protein Vi05172_g315 [Venturia inaequalis]